MHMMIADSTRGIFGSIGKLSIKIGTRIRLVELMNIVYIRACRDYVDIVTARGETLHTKVQIARLESELPAFLFARVHRSYIVNTEYIQEIRAQQNDYDLVLNTGTVITSGTTYRKQIRDRFVTARENRLVTQGTPDIDDEKHISFRSTQGNRDWKNSLRIRLCAPGDELSLAMLGQTTFIENYAGLHTWEDILAHCVSHHSPDFYRSWLKDQQTRIWILETESAGAPIGFLALTPADMPIPGCRGDDLEIQRIYLLERYRDRELCARLLAEAIHHAQSKKCRHLWVVDNEKIDRRLQYFERAGFSPRDQYQTRVGSSEYPELALGLEV